MTPNGAAIRSIREARGLGLRRLATAIRRDPAFLSRIERNQRGAGGQTLKSIAEALDVNIEAITREKPRGQ